MKTEPKYFILGNDIDGYVIMENSNDHSCHFADIGITHQEGALNKILDSLNRLHSSKEVIETIMDKTDGCKQDLVIMDIRKLLKSIKP